MADSFSKMTIEDYLERLGSGSPTPGGGAAAALTSAQGAALVMMVANHTIGKPKYAEFEELNTFILEEAGELLVKLEAGMDRDAEAFGKVSAAYALPRLFSDIQIDRVSAEIERLRSEGHQIDDINEEGMTAEIMDQIEDALKADRQAAISSASVEAAGTAVSYGGFSFGTQAGCYYERPVQQDARKRHICCGAQPRRRHHIGKLQR